MQQKKEKKLPLSPINQAKKEARYLKGARGIFKITYTLNYL